LLIGRGQDVLGEPIVERRAADEHIAGPLEPIGGIAAADRVAGAADDQVVGVPRPHVVPIAEEAPDVVVAAVHRHAADLDPADDEIVLEDETVIVRAMRLDHDVAHVAPGEIVRIGGEAGDEGAVDDAGARADLIESCESSVLTRSNEDGVVDVYVVVGTIGFIEPRRATAADSDGDVSFDEDIFAPER